MNLSSQQEPQTLICHFVWPPVFQVLLFFGSLNCWETPIFVCIRMVWWRVRFFMCFCFLIGFQFFPISRFCRCPDLTFSAFGWSWGPPKSTLTLRNHAFRLRVSASCDKSCFFCKKSNSQTNIQKHPPKSSQNRSFSVLLGLLQPP